MNKISALTLSVGHIQVTVRRSERTRRLALKIDPLLGPVLVLPYKASLRDGQAFLDRNTGWLEDRLAKAPERIPFTENAVVPILGQDHTIRHAPEARRGVWLDLGALHVSGKAEHMPRRVQDFLKAETLRVVRPLAFDLSAKINRTPTRITIRSLKSRWGSCSSAHDLSFSWRLIMAPQDVLTYVVAHEVAHMAQMNHSPAFWEVVAHLHPDYSAPRRWLKANGSQLFKYGGL